MAILRPMKEISSPNHLYAGLYDSHCHLFLLRQQGLDIWHYLRQWRAAGLESLLNIVLEPDAEAWDWHLSIARACRAEPQRYPQVFLAAGIHPNDADGSSSARYALAGKSGTGEFDAQEFARELLEPGLKQLALRAQSPEVLAIGETGLDYYRSEKNKQLQQRSLEFHISLAKSLGKVLIIHNRDSDEDLAELLCHSASDLAAGAIMHCFSGNPRLVESLLPRGFYFSFAGNVTYKNAENLRQAARLIPLERLLIETDAPFLAPQAVRGQINHPGFIGHTLDVLAQCHGLTPEAMAAYLRQNWLRLFPAMRSARSAGAQTAGELT